MLRLFAFGFGQRRPVKPPAYKRSLDTIDDMKQRARLYEENTGVALKEGVEDDDVICWDDPFTARDHREAARRCLAKYRHIDPKSLSAHKIELLLRNLKGYKAIDAVDQASFASIIDIWIILHGEEVDKITFNNIASYEP